MFPVDGAFRKIAEFCFTLMVCPKTCEIMFLANGASDEKRRNLFFCIFKNANNTCVLTLSDFHFAEFCFWVVGVAQRIAELCF